MIYKKRASYKSSTNSWNSHMYFSVCVDIDECALPTGGHICSYRCHNTPGSFHCSCPISGYTLAPNGRSCQGKPSLLWYNRCRSQAQQSYTFTSLWTQSYSPTLYLCLPDIDECVTGTHTCTGNQSCFNIQGGFRCLSFDCPVNFRRAGETWVSCELLCLCCFSITLSRELGQLYIGHMFIVWSKHWSKH